MNVAISNQQLVRVIRNVDSSHPWMLKILIRKILPNCHLIFRHGSLVCQDVVLVIQGFMVRTLKIDTKMDCFVLNFHLILEDPGKINILMNFSRYRNKNSPKLVK